MKKSEFKRIYDALKKPSDIKRMAKERRLSEEMLLVIYTQKNVRITTKRFYHIKNHSRSLLKKWSRGRSFLELASQWNFPPVLMAFIILQENKIPRRMFWEYVRNPEEIRDQRLQKEIIEIAEKDLVYSPKGNETQYERGRKGEKRLQDWLDEHEISYQTEEDLKKLYPKTPDALLEKPLKVEGVKVNWIESKASFGDEVEVRKNSKKQLKSYVELFGPGMVVYWFGVVEGVRGPKDVVVVDARFFE